MTIIILCMTVIVVASFATLAWLVWLMCKQRLRMIESVREIAQQREAGIEMTVVDAMTKARRASKLNGLAAKEAEMRSHYDAAQERGFLTEEDERIFKQ